MAFELMAASSLPLGKGDVFSGALDELTPALAPGRDKEEVYAALGRALALAEAEHVLLGPGPEGPAVVSVRLRGVPERVALAALAPAQASGNRLGAVRLEEVRVVVGELVACAAGCPAAPDWLPLEDDASDCGVLLVGKSACDGGQARRLARLAANALAAGAEMRRLRELSDEVILLLGSMVEAKHPDSAGHAEEVADYAVRLAGRLELLPEQLEQLRMAALLHDVGKIGIPEAVLNKPARLTRAERAMVQAHPALGAQLLARVEGLRLLAPLVRHHHERYDGDGYPDGLRGEAIPLGARVLAIADAFQAMTSDRSYRVGLTREEAAAELTAERGAQFDPRLVDVFLKALA